MSELATKTPLSESTSTAVGFWFDPLCPWAWITSRWVKEVEVVRGIKVSFHVMSLGYLNEDHDDPNAERKVTRWGPARVCVAASTAHGDEVLDQLYTELGTRFHNDGRGRDRDIIEEALVATGLPAELANAMESTEYDEALIRSHTTGMDQVGTDVGTPVLAFDGHAIFGPVFSPIPRGEAAGELWDAVRLLGGTDGFFELKRSRDVKPSFG